MSEHTEQQRRGILLTVSALVAVVTIIVGLFVLRMFQPTILSKEQLLANGAFVFDTPRIVKDFELIDHHGQPFNKNRLMGQWSLVFFGFTHCPDICPTTMVDLKKVYAQLQDTEAGGDVQVVMVSVDPARDTVEKLADYVPFFHADFLGVTGEFLSIYKFAQNVNIAFNKVPGSDDGQGGYNMDHSSYVVLINPMGDYHGFFKPPFELAKMKMTFRSIRKQFKH